VLVRFLPGQITARFRVFLALLDGEASLFHARI
jgi:hypothetical protein